MCLEKETKILLFFISPVNLRSPWFIDMCPLTLLTNITMLVSHFLLGLTGNRYLSSYALREHPSLFYFFYFFALMPVVFVLFLIWSTFAFLIFLFHSFLAPIFMSFSRDFSLLNKVGDTDTKPHLTKGKESVPFHLLVNLKPNFY